MAEKGEREKKEKMGEGPMREEEEEGNGENKEECE